MNAAHWTTPPALDPRTHLPLAQRGTLARGHQRRERCPACLAPPVAPTPPAAAPTLPPPAAALMDARPTTRVGGDRALAGALRAMAARPPCAVEDCPRPAAPAGKGVDPALRPLCDSHRAGARRRVRTRAVPPAEAVAAVPTARLHRTPAGVVASPGACAVPACHHAAQGHHVGLDPSLQGLCVSHRSMVRARHRAGLSLADARAQVSAAATQATDARAASRVRRITADDLRRGGLLTQLAQELDRAHATLRKLLAATGGAS